VWLVDLQIICRKNGLETWISPIHDIRICLFDMQRSWIKTRFETWITRNDVNCVCFLHLPNLLTPTAYLGSQWAPNIQIKYFMFDWSIYRLLVLNRGWKRDSHQMMIFVYVSSTCSVVELKTRFETWITRNVVNGVNLFQLSYLITLTTYLYSKWAPNVKIK
jgi:hypothetical protein